MNRYEIESKERFLEILILVSGILLAVKGVGEYLSNTIFIIFLVLSVLYYAILSNKYYEKTKWFKRLSCFIILMVSVFFSANIALALGLKTEIVYLKVIIAILYYLILIPFLYISLDYTGRYKDFIKFLKKIKNKFN